MYGNMLYVAIDLPCIEIVCAYQCALLDLYDFNDGTTYNVRVNIIFSFLERASSHFSAAHCTFHYVYSTFVVVPVQTANGIITNYDITILLSSIIITVSSDVVVGRSVRIILYTHDYNILFYDGLSLGPWIGRRTYSMSLLNGRHVF